jgi:hypothetical protein
MLTTCIDQPIMSSYHTAMHANIQNIRETLNKKLDISSCACATLIAVDI